MLELSREVKTNHLGLLILDEPSQQETAEISFADFLKRASTAKKYSQQVLFAASEIETNLLKTLSNIPHNYINFVGKIVKRFDS